MIWLTSEGPMNRSQDRAHDHSRPSLKELCPMSATALLGTVAAIVYANENPYVFWSGLAILGLAACRSIVLLHSFVHAGFRRDSGSIPWRCFLLIFPVLLFFFGPPVTSAKPVRARSSQSNAIYMTWEEVKAWANDEAKREWSQGRIGVIVGNYLGSKSGRAFPLGEPRIIDHGGVISVRCAQEIGDIKVGLVQVTGEIQYRKDK